MALLRSVARAISEADSSSSPVKSPRISAGRPVRFPAGRPSPTPGSVAILLASCGSVRVKVTVKWLIALENFTDAVPERRNCSSMVGIPVPRFSQMTRSLSGN